MVLEQVIICRAKSKQIISMHVDDTYLHARVDAHADPEPTTAPRGALAVIIAAIAAHNQSCPVVDGLGFDGGDVSSRGTSRKTGNALSTLSSTDGGLVVLIIILLLFLSGALLGLIGLGALGPTSGSACSSCGSTSSLDGTWTSLHTWASFAWLRFAISWTSYHGLLGLDSA